jgi:lipid-binding SYLF domain-containing protein
MMRAPMVLFAAALALPALAAPAARAQGREAATVAAAVEVIEQAGTIPARCIPLGLLRDAKGVAIIPGIIKAGLVIGGRHGRGVVLVRCPDGGWSNPIFVTLTGGSIGWQVGAQSTDLVLVFKTQRGVERILQNRGKLTLGADVSVAAGPVGREAAAATDAQLRAEIYSYSRSRGLFAGASFEGDALLIDRRGNDCFYGRGGVSPADIVANNGILIPPVALKLRAVLTAQSNPPVAVPLGPPPVIIERPLPPMPPPLAP